MPRAQAAGHVDAALLSALSRGAGAYEVRSLLRLGASPHAAFLDKGALALAARGSSAQVTDAHPRSRLVLPACAHLGRVRPSRSHLVRPSRR